MSKTTEKIEKLLSEKGWTVICIDYDPVFMGGTGREGGWEIDFDTESDDLPDDLFNNLPTKIEGCDVFDIGDGYIRAYTKEDVFRLIKEMPFNPTKKAA